MKFFHSWERAGRDAMSALLEKVLHVEKAPLPRIRQALQDGGVQKILLVRNYQGMGDLLCATPVIAALKSQFPHISLHFLANTFNAAVLRDNPKLDHVWEWDEHRKGDPRQWVRLRRQLIQERFDLAIVVSGNALSLTAILWAVLSKARWVVGSETAVHGQRWGKQWYSCEIPEKPTTHETDRYAALIEGLGVPCPDRVPEFFIRTDHRAAAERFWKDHFESAPGPFVGIFLGGKVDRPDRIWPPANYAKVAARLRIEAHAKLLVIAPPLPTGRASHTRQSTFWRDEAVHEKIFRQTYGIDVPIFRHRDLGNVGAVLEKLDLLICPDGGMMHVAAALHVPTLTLFIGTDPGRWHPRAPTSHALRAPDHHPDGLSANAVSQAALDLLRSTRS